MSKKKIAIIVAVIILAVACIMGFFVIGHRGKGDASGKAQVATVEGQEKKQKQTATEKKSKDKSKTEETEMDALTIWTTDKINLREQPGDKGDVLEVLNKNTELTATAETKEWYKVSYNDKVGYVSKTYVTTDKPEEDANQSADTNSTSSAVAIGPSPSTGGHVICIDPGHQVSGDSTPEPNGPGSATTKARVTGGTTGTTTGVPEYQLNLAIALQLQQELQARGYTVYMTRTSHEVNISNKERAEFATSVGAEITIRIHANGSTNSGVSGALALAPSAGNPYVGQLAAASQSLSSCVLNAYCGATGLANQGVQANDTMTGINWCTMPVTILEMGYMTNPGDDTSMQDPGFQQKMVWGIANGIDTYFGN